MSRTSRTLQAELHSICQTYFPRWRNATTWTLREGPRGHFVSRGRRQTTSEMGFCDMSLKTIWVNCHRDQRTATLIHEVCHAVAGPGHGKRWCARIRAAGQQAARLGDAGLAAELIKEADSYADTPCVTASEIYCRVEQV